jgi:integrase
MVKADRAKRSAERAKRTDKTTYGKWDDKLDELNPLIVKCLREHKARQVKDSSLLGLRKTLIRLDNFCSIDKITKDDLINYLGNMKSLVKPKKNAPPSEPKPLSETTIHNHSNIIKTYFQSVGKPELVDWIKLKKPSEKLSPDDILTTEEINALLEAADGEYWKALISFLWDAGCRISEAMSLRWRDLIFTVDGIKTTIPNHKTGGSRPIILPVCKNYMMNLKTFSGGKPDDFIFNKDYRYMARHILTIKERAVATCPSLTHKKVNFHMFRHASATESVRRNIRMVTLKHKYGWSEKSTVYNRYLHLSDTDHNEEIMRIAGKEGTSRVPVTNIKEDEIVSLTTTADLVFELERKMNEKDTELADIREKQEQIRITEEDQEKRLAEYEKQLQANPKLRLDEEFVASMAADALRGSKMSFQKEEEETQEKSNEQRIKELEKMVELLMKEKMVKV